MTGSTIYSYDTNRHTCAVTGATWGITGRDYTGGNDKIVIPSDASLQITGDMSILAWVNPTAVGDAHHIICQKDDQGVEGTVNYYFALHTTIGAPNLGHYDTGWHDAQGDNAVSAGVWSQVAATLSGTTITYYINGAVSGSTKSLVGTLTTAGGSLTAGCQLAAGSIALPFDNIIGELLIYNRALSASEVARYNQATKWRYT